MRAGAQRGQALAEFLVVALALVPLFLLVPMIAKYQDIAQATQAASRYAAFDAVNRHGGLNGWKPESELAGEVRRRFFGDAGAPVKTGDVAGDFAADQNKFWRDPRGDALIREFGRDVQVQFGAGNGPRHLDGFAAASDGVPFLLRDQMSLQARGIYRADVSVRLSDLPAGMRFYEPFDRLGLSMRRGTSVAIDAWTASGPAQVESRASSDPQLFPAGSLAGVSALANVLVRGVDLPGGLSGPRLGELDFWRDVVPQDRLRGRN